MISYFFVKHVYVQPTSLILREVLFDVRMGNSNFGETGSMKKVTIQCDSMGLAYIPDAVFSFFAKVLTNAFRGHCNYKGQLICGMHDNVACCKFYSSTSHIMESRNFG